MSGLPEIVDSLEYKLKQLLRKMEMLEKRNRELEEKLSESAIVNGSQLEEIMTLKKQNETLKMANSLLGSDDNKRETKLKINSLIREIDYCIAQLSD
jgi:cell division septum initiation protein DivIVA